MLNQHLQMPILEKGNSVKLIQKPDGYLSRHYPLTVGEVYIFHKWLGSCAVITTDDPDVTASIHFSRLGPA